MTFKVEKKRFSFFVQEHDIDIKGITVYGFFTTSDTYDVSLTCNSGAPKVFSATNGGSDTKTGGFALGDYTLTIQKGGVDAPEAEVRDVMLVLECQGA